MLSSTIGELADLRLTAMERVESAAIADAWLFEMHAVASGAAPAIQYLDLARSCDLFVVIVASQYSAATEAEYEAAHADNPEKVLPFFVGDGSAEVEGFRELLESRHTRVKRRRALDLVNPIAQAIIGAVESGRILRSALIRVLDDRIERSRCLVADIPMILEPKIVTDGLASTARESVARDMHVALSGIGGSGKTLCAALSARRLAKHESLLPIFASCWRGVTSVGGPSGSPAQRHPLRRGRRLAP